MRALIAHVEFEQCYRLGDGDIDVGGTAVGILALIAAKAALATDAPAVMPQLITGQPYTGE